MSRANRWKSEAQSNAEALARRDRTYTAASDQSFTVAWNYHNREPKDLREAVRMVRQAYADEVPTRMHNQDLADDGTPKMTPQAEGYIFGSDTSGEARKVEGESPPVLDFYRTPCRAAIANLRRHSRLRADIVHRVAVGEARPVDSAIAAAVSVGIPRDFAYECAEITLRSFLKNLSDIKLHLPQEETAA